MKSAEFFVAICFSTSGLCYYHNNNYYSLSQSNVKSCAFSIPLCVQCMHCVLWQLFSLKILLRCCYICTFVSVVAVAEAIHEVGVAVMEGTVIVAETVAMAAEMEATVVETGVMVVVVAETAATNHGAMVAAGEAVVTAEEEGEIVTAAEAVVAAMAEGMVKDTAVAEVAVEETPMEAMGTKGVDPTGTGVVALPPGVVEG